MESMGCKPAARAQIPAREDKNLGAGGDKSVRADKPGQAHKPAAQAHKPAARAREPAARANKPVAGARGPAVWAHRDRGSVARTGHGCTLETAVELPNSRPEQ